MQILVHRYFIKKNMWGKKLIATVVYVKFCA